MHGRESEDASAPPPRRAADATRVRRRARVRPVRGSPRREGSEADRVQLSGNRSTNTRSPADMVLTVTRRASDSRIAEPSGSRRAEVDIIGHGVGQLVDRNIHRLLEADHEDRAGRGDLGLDIVGEFEHQPGIAAGRGERGLALDRIRPAGPAIVPISSRAAASHHGRSSQRRTVRAIRANSRPKSSGSRSRHCSMGLSVRRSDRQRDALARAGEFRIGELRTC